MQSGFGRMLAIVVGVSALAGVAGGLSAWVVADSVAGDQGASELVSATPGTDYIEAFRCAPGLIKTVQMHGVEDHFDRAGDEPADLRPALLENAAFFDLDTGRVPNSSGTRDYDERGVDKFLFDHFEIPRGVVNGEVVMSLMAQGDNMNDSIHISDLDEFSRRDSYEAAIEFTYVPNRGNSGTRELIEGLYKIPLSDFQRNPLADFDGNLVDFINSAERPDALDFGVAEDTVVDYVAIITCRQPEEAMGTALREFRVKVPVEGMSVMICGQDFLAPLCVPHSGHLSCSKPTPIACYKDGDRQPPDDPDGILKATVPFRFFVGGEVRLSEPVRGDALPTLADAAQVCEAQFGEGWRVLSYHEGGGGGVISYSDIPVNAEGFVHVADRPYGNCWDRPESVIGK